MAVQHSLGLHSYSMFIPCLAEQDMPSLTLCILLDSPHLDKYNKDGVVHYICYAAIVSKYMSTCIQSEKC